MWQATFTYTCYTACGNNICHLLFNSATTSVLYVGVCELVDANVGGAATADRQQRILNAFFQVKCTRMRSNALLLMSLKSTQQVFVVNVVAINILYAIVSTGRDAELQYCSKFFFMFSFLSILLLLLFLLRRSTLLLILVAFCMLRCAGVTHHRHNHCPPCNWYVLAFCCCCYCCFIIHFSAFRLLQFFLTCRLIIIVGDLAS